MRSTVRRLCARAVRLEERLGANARIYYKYEGANLTGSHKLNTALPQAYYYARAGVKHVVTGTGAGQWGTALAYASKIMNLDCTRLLGQIHLAPEAHPRRDDAALRCGRP